jgi:hypothetical protein
LLGSRFCTVITNVTLIFKYKTAYKTAYWNGATVTGTVIGTEQTGEVSKVF